MGGSDPAALCELLDEELAYDATTSSRLSNHLPMALVALDRLGAGPDRLREFAVRYATRLVPVAPATPVATFDEWRAARGAVGSYAAVRPYLERELAERGTGEVLRRHLPYLVDGLSGAAFHGVIRLAYALESESQRRVAAGLAYTTSVHQPLGPPRGREPLSDDPAVALRHLAASPLAAEAGRGNIGERMRTVGAHPAFDGVIDWLEVTDDTPDWLIAAAVALYAATDDFTALHGVTASHAISVVAPYVEDQATLCRYWFQALAAVYVTIGAPRLDDPARRLEPWLSCPPSWSSIEAGATTSDDEHVVKLVYTARELAARHGDPLLLACAARRAGVAPVVS